MQSESKTAIVIVAYNRAEFINLQLNLINHFCKDDPTIVVVDNSTDEEQSRAIQYHCQGRENVILYRVQASSRGGSSSHAFAANFGFKRIRTMEFDYYMYLDHDNFPVKPFSVKEILSGCIMAGLGQKKSETYFWPGLVMWDADFVDDSDIDFSPDKELGLDTGGGLWHIVKQHEGSGNLKFLNEIHYQNPYFNKNHYDFYAMLADETFMHFINGSNWNNQEEDTERINSLINILKEKTRDENGGYIIP